MNEPTSQARAAAERPDWQDWRRRGLIGLILVVLAVLAAVAGAAFIPRWWAQRIGDQVDGSFSAGVGVGLFYGFAFTALALLVLWWTFRRRRHWKVWLAGLVLTAIVAAPNLMTLGIVLGSGNAAHAGERILDVDAPAFRNSTLIGALAAGVLVAGCWYLVFSRGRARRSAQELRAQAAEGDAEPEAEGAGSSR